MAKVWKSDKDLRITFRASFDVPEEAIDNWVLDYGTVKARRTVRRDILVALDTLLHDFAEQHGFKVERW